MTLAPAVSPDLESVAGAQARLLDGVRTLPSEQVGLDAALGRILAQTVSSQSDMPGFDNSAMDGYAVRASEIATARATAPVRLPVVGESRAGSMPIALAAGTAMRIMTGAPMPAGADTVVRQEDTTRDDDDVLIEVATAIGTSVRWRGADMACRAPPCCIRVWSSRASISPSPRHSATLSSSLAARPRVAILATGDELVPAGTSAGPSPARRLELADARRGGA